MTAPVPSRAPASRPLVAALVVITALGTVVQARMNGEMVVITGNAPEIGLLNIVAGFVVATAVILLRPNLRASWAATLRGLRLGQLRWWEVLGGVGGIFFVTVQSACAPVIGVAVFTVAVVAGQTSNAVVVDKFGLGPGGRTPITPLRLVAVAVAVIAVGVAVSDRFDPSRLSDSRVALAFAGLALCAGAASAVQSALNGRVARVAGRPLIAGWTNFVVGLTIGALGLVLFRVLGGLEIRPLPLDRPWLLLAGVLGLVYVSTAAWAVRPLGVLLTAVLSVVGLLFGALVVDLVAPTAGTRFGWHLVAGVLLALAAAALAALGRGTSRPLPSLGRRRGA